MNDLLTILLARSGSSRLPDKVLAPVEGSPLLAWIIRRLTHPTNGLGPPKLTVVATTDQPGDNRIAAVAKAEGVIPYRYQGDPNDVVGRVAAVVGAVPSARWIFIALADCPFVETSLVRRSLFALKKWGGDAILWYLPPNTWPLYGAREMSWSRKAIKQIAAGAKGPEREHYAMWFNKHRELFNIIYHDPPDRVYFRHPHSMRLEVDWPEDLELVRAVARGPGMLAPLDEIIRWLDQNDRVARLNSHRIEKTGPVRSYDDRTRINWFRLMKDAKIVTWENELREPPDHKRTFPIHCICGALLGWGWRGELVHVDGHHIEKGFISCGACGTGMNWIEKKESSRNR